MKIINTFDNIQEVFNKGHFDLEKWKKYIDEYLPGVKQLCIEDMKECLKAGLSWEEDYLPVLDSVYSSEEKIKELLDSFNAIVNGLDEKIEKKIQKTLDVEIVLYLGLCNGAGWVTKVNGKTTVLLGIEKIIELDWCSINDMNDLIIHELGHVYQSQFGVLERETKTNEDKFIWQLFTEGVAMVFEQKIVEDDNYFHQDKNDWKLWCDKNVKLIAKSFDNDLKTMKQDDQCYFGDWVLFHDHGDTGYYLGTLFVKFLLEDNLLENIIKYDVKRVEEEYKRFIYSVVDIN